MSLWCELTDRQKVKLGILHGYSYSLPAVHYPPNSTERSLVRRGLATSWRSTDGLCWICLTPEGHRVIAQKSPMWWIGFMRTHNMGGCTSSFIRQLPLEELAEFLTSRYAIDRYIAHTTAEKLLTQ